MAEQISDNEIVGLFRELQAMALQVKEADARVSAAHEEWRRVSREKRALGNRWQELSNKLNHAHRNIFEEDCAIEADEPKSPTPKDLTQQEHQVWLSAYSAAHAEPGMGGVSRPSAATKVAREAVEAYRKLVSGAE